MKKLITLLLLCISLSGYSQNSFWNLQFGLSKEKVIEILSKKGYKISINEDNLLQVKEVYFENIYFQRSTMKFVNNRLVVCRFANEFKKEDKDIFISTFDKFTNSFNNKFGKGNDLTSMLKARSLGWIIDSANNSGISMIIQTDKPLNLFTIIYSVNVNKSY